MVLEFEVRVYTLSHSTSLLFFVKGFFKIGSHGLLAQAGFKVLSS
jgi:hypothetical protein